MASLMKEKALLLVQFQLDDHITFIQKRNQTNSAVQPHTWSGEYLLHKPSDEWWNCIQMCKKENCIWNEHEDIEQME